MGDGSDELDDGCGVLMWWLAVGHRVVKLVKWWRVGWQQQGTPLCMLVWFSTRFCCGCRVSFLMLYHYKLPCQYRRCWCSAEVPIWVFVGVILRVDDVVFWEFLLVWWFLWYGLSVGYGIVGGVGCQCFVGILLQAIVGEHKGRQLCWWHTLG